MSLFPKITPDDVKITLEDMSPLEAPSRETLVGGMEEGRSGALALADILKLIERGDLPDDVQEALDLAATALQKDLLERGDLPADVLASLALADSALQGIPDLSVTTAKLDNFAVTNGKMDFMPEGTIKGRAAGAGNGQPQDLSASSARTAMGASSVGSAVFTAADAAAARTAIDALGPNETADRAFRRGNILSTVSQSGGVPTGAVIERGSNANGSYVRFADGTQICWTQTTVFMDLIAFQLVSMPAAFASGSFPVSTMSFASDASTGTNANWRSGAEILVAYTTSTGCNYLSRAGAFGASGVVYGLHVGRWF